MTARPDPRPHPSAREVPAAALDAPLVRGRVATIDALRGLAALAVCWFHLTLSGGESSPALLASGRYGRHGVEAFFVISGFVIPYALRRSSYRLGDFWRFLAKRVARVDPPYLAAIAVTVGLAFVAAHAPGSNAVFAPPSARSLLLHLGYAVPFVPGATWVNIVFWTLAVEFQYYLVIGLAYPLVASRNESRALGAVAVLLAASVLLPAPEFFPAHAPLFVLGIYLFRLRAGLTSRATLVGVASVALVVAAVMRGGPPTIAGGLAAALIFADQRGVLMAVPGAFRWLGRVSYSLYLLHVPVGALTVAVAKRLLLGRLPGWAPGQFAGDLLVRLIGLAACLVAADVFYRLAERPAQRLASRIAYRDRPASVAALE